jgi:hypothetical protein
MQASTIVFFCALAVIWVAAAVRYAWIIADDRGWKRGFKASQDIWRTAYYELVEQMKREGR